MAQTTPFTIGAEARCADGACGKVSSVVLDPVARAVTHLVIDRQGVPRLVPLDLIDATTGQIRLGCGQEPAAKRGAGEYCRAVA